MTGAVGRDTVVERAGDVHTVHVDGEAILLDQATGQLHLLNETAALVWSHLDGEVTLGDLSQALAGSVDVGLDRVLEDITAIVDRLVDEGAARVVR